MMTQQLETAIVVYLYIDEDREEGSCNTRSDRGCTHLSFSNFTGTLKLFYMGQIGDAVFPAGLPQQPEVVDAVVQPEVIDAVVPAARLPKPKVIDLLTPKAAARPNVHDSPLSYARGSTGVNANGEGMKIKVEGSRNKRNRSDNTQEPEVYDEQSNSPPSKKTRICPSCDNRKLG
jgi:hypothetical protein